MKYASLAIGLILCIATGNTSAARDPGQPGPTAKSISHLTIGSIKMAALADKDGDLSARTCIAKLDDHALAGLFEQLFAENFSKDEMLYMDVFYSTPLADKFVRYTLEQLLIRNNGSVSAPTKLTPDEAERYKKYDQADASKKLTAVASMSEGPATAVVRPALVAMIQGCRAGS